MRATRPPIGSTSPKNKRTIGRTRGWLLVGGTCVVAVAICAASSVPRVPGPCRSAQCILSDTLANARARRASTDDYTTVTLAAIGREEPRGVQVVPLGQAGVHRVGVQERSTSLLLVTRDSSGTWYCILDDLARPPRVRDDWGHVVYLTETYGKGATREAVTSAGQCQDPSW